MTTSSSDATGHAPSDAYNDQDYDQTDHFGGFYDIVRRKRLEEWRQRQAYYQRHGHAPAINIIRPGRH